MVNEEHKLKLRIQYLMHKLFYSNPEGQELLELIKQNHINTPTFPQNAALMAAYGGPLAWAAHREGALTFIEQVRKNIQDHEDRVKAENNQEIPII